MTSANMRNWMECVRSRKTPNASIEAGYNHSVALCMNIAAIQTGQKLIVKNSDPCLHNIHATPTVPGNPETNQGQGPGAADLTYTYTQPEMFLRFKCDVHPWMFAWVSVFDSPYYCVSSQDGKFVIKNVPPGKYTVEAAHRKLGTQTQDVEVKDGDVTANFSFAVK